MWNSLLDVLPHGYSLDEDEWQRRHRLLLWLLGLHVPALVILGLVLGHSPTLMLLLVVTPLLCVLIGQWLRLHRRTAADLSRIGLNSDPAFHCGQAREFARARPAS